MQSTPQTQLRAHLKSGMTLLEIVIVIGIIAIILGAGIGGMNNIQNTSKIVSTEKQIQSLEAVLESYKILAGSYPSEAQGLDALTAKPSVQPVPKKWMKQINSVPQDQWQSAYVYKNPGSKDQTTYEIISMGPDKQLGTEDDISNQD